MRGSTCSAAYFCRTAEVDEFLAEFIRFRQKVLELSSPPEEPDPPDASEDAPYRRPKFQDHSEPSDDHSTTGSAEVCDSDDNLLNVAVQMTLHSDVHLDAFISLVDSYYTMAQEHPEFGPAEYQLDQVLRNARITSRKFPVIEERTDIEWSKKLAHELKYRRQTADIRERMHARESRVFEFKPPIISGLNVFFGVALTFVGAYSISGALGVKDPLHRSLIGIGFSFVALIVDTVMYVLRPTPESKRP